MAREGAKVVVSDIGAALRGDQLREPVADQVVREIQAFGGQAIADHGDVSSWRDAQALVNKAIATWSKLDILVNVAGILRERMIFNMTAEEWDDVVRVHLKGTFCTTHFAALHWAQRREYGRLINFTSDAGISGSPGQPNYSAAKAGIVGFTRAVANAMVRLNVTANCIAPQAATRMTDETAQGVEHFRRTGRQMSEEAVGTDGDPANVAPLVVYLASPQASNISGRTFGAKGWRYTLYSEPEEERFLGHDATVDLEGFFKRFQETLGRELKLEDLSRAASRGLAGLQASPGA
jgi:NAD(P)-dependent dehydrogenase (short-subunit alcohol dehydrogenase family)